MMSRRRLLYPLLILLLGVAVYANSFSGIFVFDDSKTIEDNPRIRHILPRGQTELLRRCAVDMTFAVNYATSRLNIADYHATNLLVHLLAGLLLYGIVRRTLLLPRCPDRFRTAAPEIAVASAAIWIVHPLTTSAVTYICQRYECMMAMFYLMTIYCVIRAEASLNKFVWYSLAVVACVLGFASKEVMVTAPIVLLIYDRIFLSDSFHQAFRKRWHLYTMLCLVYLFAIAEASMITDMSGSNAAGTFSMSYGITQCRVITRYLRLSAWPYPLCIDYGWAPIQDLAPTIPSVALIALLGIGSLVALRYAPQFGFIGIAFFAILAPSSSFLVRPDPVFEHRMYLPLAVLVTGVVAAIYEIFCRLQTRRVFPSQVGTYLMVSLASAVVAGFGFATHFRNRDYQSPERILGEAIERYPDNIRPYVGLTRKLCFDGRYQEAAAYCRKALDHLPDFTRTNRPDLLALHGTDDCPTIYGQAFNYSMIQNNLALALQRQGKLTESAYHFEEALRIAPGNLSAHMNLGSVLFSLGRTQEAIARYRYVVSLSPSDVDAHQCLAESLAWTGDMQGAVDSYNAVLRLDPHNVLALTRLAWILATSEEKGLRDGRRAVQFAGEAIRESGQDNTRCLDVLAAAYAEAGMFTDAVKTCSRALELSGKHEEQEALKKRLELYRRAMPYREPRKWISASAGKGENISDASMAK
jgi:protein O-mannosyl-transferase